MQQNTPREALASGLTRAEEIIFITFIYLVPTYCGSRLAMDVIAKQPIYYWRLYWSEYYEDREGKGEDQINWLMRAIELPLDCQTNYHWELMTEKTREHIVNKTSSMANRAMALMAEWGKVANDE